MKNFKKIVLILIGIILLIGLSGFGYVYSKLNKMYVKDEVVKDIENTEEATIVDGITNILLVGTDGEYVEKGNRSDGIMLVTIDSKNKDIFVALAKEKAGINVEIISGDRESNLGFRGVLEGIEKAEDILVIDIGGGSTEFIIGNDEGIRFSKSENVGALRMTEKFLHKDPINETEFYAMSNFIYEELKNTLECIKKDKIKKLVGIGGTITSLSAINQELEVYSMDKIHNSKVTLNEIELILQNLKKMTLNDKKTLKGLQPKRADIITAGVEILHTIMKNLEIKEITVSEYDNLEGLMCQNIKNMS